MRLDDCILRASAVTVMETHGGPVDWYDRAATSYLPHEMGRDGTADKALYACACTCATNG
jgi:hypothetical protein